MGREPHATTEIPQLDDSETTQPILNDDKPTADDNLSIRIPRDIWDTETRRKDLGIVLDDGVIKDADGDVIMNTSDSINYGTNDVPMVQYLRTYGALYINTIPCQVESKYVYRFTIKQCIQRNGEEKTIEELRREMQQMITRSVWIPVMWEYLTDEERRSTISSSMFLKEKFDANCKFDKLKARLVAGGHQQDRSVYSDSETSSLTVSTTSLFLIAQWGRGVLCVPSLD